MAKTLTNKDLTTGQVAKLLGVAVRTVIKWCDKGGLRYYRVPQSPDRRFPRAWLVDFMVEQKVIDKNTEEFLRKCVEGSTL